MQRPYVQINCASTLDGKIARPDGSRLRISNEADMQRVHKLRADLGAILVGSGTIIADDPKLSVKEKHVPDPPELTKIVLDGRGRVPASSRFLRSPGRSIIATTTACSSKWLDEMTRSIDEDDLDAVILILESDGDMIAMDSLMEELGSMDIKKLLVEGGSSTIWNFVSNDIFDRFTIYIAPILIGGNGPTVMGGKGHEEQNSRLELSSMERDSDGGIFLDYLHVKDQ